MYKPRILVVEDDPAISNLIRTPWRLRNTSFIPLKTAPAP